MYLFDSSDGSTLNTPAGTVIYPDVSGDKGHSVSVLNDHPSDNTSSLVASINISACSA